MKITRKLLATLAITLATLCPLKADEALDTFKKDVDALKTFMAAKKEEMKKTPPTFADRVLTLRAMDTKLRAFKTDGLPEDLKTAFVDFVAAFDKMTELVKPFPETAAEINAFADKKKAEDPPFMDDFKSKMKAVSTDMQPLAKKVSEAAKQHGVTAFEEVGK